MAAQVLVLVPQQESLGAGFPLPLNQRFVIGRKTTCKLILPEEYAYVSGEHCVVTVSSGDPPGEAKVSDLSANGTFVNAKRIGKGKHQTIKIGDEISLAKPSRSGGAIRFKLAEGAEGCVKDEGGVQAAPAQSPAAEPCQQQAGREQPPDPLPPAAGGAAASSSSAHAAAAAAALGSAAGGPAASEPNIHRPHSHDDSMFQPAAAQNPWASSAGQPGYAQAQAGAPSPDLSLRPAVAAAPSFEVVGAPHATGGAGPQARATPGMEQGLLSAPGLVAAQGAPSFEMVQPDAPAAPPAVRPQQAQHSAAAPVGGFAGGYAEAPRPQSDAPQERPVAHAAQPGGPSREGLAQRHSPGADSSAFAEAMLGEKHRESEHLTRLKSRGEEEARVVQELSAKLDSVRLEHSEERERVRARGPGSSLLQFNTRVAEEQEELRARLRQVQAESAELQRAQPLAEEAIARDRLECAQIREELLAEQQCMERHELQAAALRSEVEEATAREQVVRTRMSEQAAQNARLEQEVEAARAEAAQASARAASEREALSSRTAALETLRAAVRENLNMLRENQRALEQALAEVGTSASVGDGCSAVAAGVEAPGVLRGTPLGPASAAALRVGSSSGHHEDSASTQDADMAAGAAPLAKRRRSEGASVLEAEPRDFLPGWAG